MEQKQSIPFKPRCPQILLWCCFCDGRFKRSYQLDRHLDRYKVNWKLYWQLHYSSHNSLSCPLCDILHADRESLQCHFKMVHCISGQPCAVRGQVSLEPARHESDQKDPSHTLKPFGRPPEMPYDALKTTHAQKNVRRNRGVHNSTNMDEVDVLFEVNRADSPSAELSNYVRPSVSNVPLGTTVACTEPLSEPDDDVQVLEEVEPSCSSSQGSGGAIDDEPAVILADGSDLSRFIAPSSVITVLGSDDEIEELESHEVAMASLSGEIMEGYEGGVACAQVEDSRGHDASAVARSCRGGMHTNIPSVTPSVCLPTESGHDRPTAVVNPFGSQQESWSRSTSSDTRIQNKTPLRSDMAQLPSCATAADDSWMSLPETRQREFYSEENVVSSQDPLSLRDGCGHCPADALANTRPSSGDCGPDGSVCVENVSSERTVHSRSNQPSARFPQHLPDLSRLTPSKIAAFMNRDVLPMSCQPDFESHFEEKPLHNVSHGTISVDTNDRLLSPGESYDSDADIKLGSTTEGRHVESEGQSGTHNPEPHGEPVEKLPGKRKWMHSTGGSSTEDEDSLPCGLSIVSVETLLAKKLENDEPEPSPEPLAIRLGSSAKKQARLSSRMSRRTRSNAGLAKGTIEDPDLPGCDGYTVCQRTACPAEEHGAKLSPAKKKQDSSQLGYPSNRTRDEEAGPVGVFKQPIWQCVGVVHPGSLVEVSIPDELRSSWDRESLDGMVMKVNDSESLVRYFIRFPNLDIRHDRWVTMEDIIQVYRTEEDTAQKAAGTLAAAASPSRPTKRRLAFDPSPERRLSFEPAPAAERPVPQDEAEEAPVAAQLASRQQCGHLGKQAARKWGSPKQARSRTLTVPHSLGVEGVTELTRHRKAPDQSSSPPAETGPATQASGSPRTRRSRSIIASMARRPGPPSHPPARPEQEAGVAVETPDWNQNPPAQAAPVTQPAGPPGKRRGRPPKAIASNAEGTGSASCPPARLECAAGVVRKRPHGQIGREPKQVGSARRRRGAKTTKEGVTADVSNLPARTGRKWEDTEQALDTLAQRSGLGAQTRVRAQRGGRRAAGRRGPIVEASPADDPAPDPHQSILPTTDGGAAAVAGAGTEPALHQDVRTVCLRAREEWSRRVGDDTMVDMSTSHVNVSDNHTKTARGTRRPGRSSVISVGKDPSPAGEARGDGIGTPAAADPDARPAAGADPAPASAATGPRKRRSFGLKTRPPKGVITQPAVASVLETLRAGSVVYVACLTDDHGWRRLYPAEVVRVNRDLWYPRYRVHYPGWRVKHDEWIAEDVIHSVVTSHSQMRTLALRACWKVPPQTAESRTLEPALSSLVAEDTRRVDSHEQTASVPGAPVDGIPGGRRPTQYRATEHPAQLPEARRAPGLLAVLGSSLGHLATRGRGRNGLRRLRNLPEIERQVRFPAHGKAFGRSPVKVGRRQLLPRLRASARGTPKDTDRGEPAVTQTTPETSQKPPVLEVGATGPAGVAATTTGMEQRRLRSRPLSLGQPPDFERVETPSAPASAPAAGDVAAVTGASGAGAAGGKPRPRSCRGAARPPFADPATRQTRAASTEGGTEPPALRPEVATDRPRQLKVPPAPATSVTAPTSAVRDRYPGPATGSEASDPADRVATSPADSKTLKRLKPDDVVYVVYETTKDGTKFTYAAKILKMRKDAQFTYFFVHYLGWSRRHNEWIMGEVIHSVVDLSQLPDGLRSLKRRMVPASAGPAHLAAYRRLRPCSVDLSANNICFFSALRKERFHVADRRIMALREARRGGRQGGWSAGAVP